MGISALIGFDGAGVPLLLPPAFIFFAGALLALFLRGPVRSAALLLTVAASGLYTLSFEAGTSYHHLVTFWGGHATTTLDRLSLLFGYLFHLAALIALIFSLHVKDTRQHVAGMVYAGSALGAVFAGDLITLFVYWELVALSSTLLIWLRDSERSRTTALRYFMVHMTSGVLLLAGAALYHQQTGSWAFTFIGLEGLAGWLIFIAFGIKCAFPFLHNWLTDSYPESTPTGTVFLSAFTTKVGVYALARGYPGTELLIYIGAFDDLLSHLLRRHRERSPPRALLQHDQPARLHGGGHRDRHSAGHQRRRLARLQRRHLQGLVVHVDGRGPCT